MNRIYMVFAIAMLVLQACGGVKRVEKKPQVMVTPEKQQLFVNVKTDPYTVQVNYTLNVPRNYVPSCSRLIYSPFFVGQGNEYALTPIVITGKNYYRLDERLQLFGEQLQQPDVPGAVNLISTGDSMKVVMSQVVPFQLWMPDSKLVAKVSLEACDHKVDLYDQILADGMVYIPQSLGPVVVEYVKKEVSKKEEGFARFYYPVNGYTVDPRLFDNGRQLNDMTELIRKVMDDTAAVVNRIVITGICSPDGSWTYNENLAKKRAENIRDYLVANIKIPANLLDVKYIAEDWGGLQKLIEGSDMPGKDAALSIIDRVAEPDQREAVLRRLPDFKYIKEYFYPELRKVSYEVYYTVKETVIEVKPE